jgi:hypothetical protein
MPTAQEIHDAYLTGASRAPENYKKGVAKVNDWQQRAIEGEDNYASGVSKAVANKTRAKALAGVSNSTWQSKAQSLGSVRIADGMRSNADKRMKNYEPIRGALESLSLPNKTTDPMSNIDSRLKKVVETEINAKKARLGI